MNRSETTLCTSSNTISGKHGSSPITKTKSYSSQRSTHKDISRVSKVSTDEMMDDDEARWMSVFESSRTPTPNTQVTRSSRRPEAAYLEHSSHSRNMTPPLPPLSEEHINSVSHKRMVTGSTDSTAGLTALPQHAGMLQHTFAQRVFLASRSDLLYNYSEKHRSPWDFRTVRQGAIDLTTLQQMQKLVLQQKLVAQVRAIGARGAWMEIGIGQTLHEYCQVLRDLDYMEKHATGGKHDHAFLITTARPLEAQLLEEADLARQTPRSRSVNGIVARIRHLRRGCSCLKLIQRMLLMLMIGATLILPYLLMVFVHGYLARIIVSCACIAIFAACIAVLSGKNDRLLPAIALTVVYGAAVIIFAGVTPPYYAR